MTKTFELTAGELKVAKILVADCLHGMGGKRPAHLENDEFTWTDAKVLMAKGYSRHEAAGFFSSLMEKGFVQAYGKNEWIVSTDGWRWLDTVWDTLA